MKMLLHIKKKKKKLFVPKISIIYSLCLIHIINVIISKSCKVYSYLAMFHVMTLVEFVRSTHTWPCFT